MIRIYFVESFNSEGQTTWVDAEFLYTDVLHNTTQHSALAIAKQDPCVNKILQASRKYPSFKFANTMIS